MKLRIEDITDINQLWVDKYSTNSIHGVQYIKDQVVAIWLDTHHNQERYNKKLASTVSRIVKNSGDKIPVFMIYGMINRDLGQYSGGGCHSYDEYKFYINQFVRGLGEKQAVVIVESDSLPHLRQLDGDDRQERLDCLIYAIERLQLTNALVYVDAGHPNWNTAEQSVELLNELPLDKFHGITLNVSNYVSTDDCVDYAKDIYDQTGLTSIIDTSRNAQVTSRWNNPFEQRLGTPPKIVKSGAVDMHLWIKIPGESDGKCFGFPRAGKWDQRLIDLLRGKDINAIPGIKYEN